MSEYALRIVYGQDFACCEYFNYYYSLKKYWRGGGVSGSMGWL